jgi:type IV pilus assembly protein PilA
MTRNRGPRRPARGFTWIEMLLVIAVLGVLGLMAIPAMQDNALKRQVKEGLALSDVAKKGVQAAYTAAGDMPADNKAAGIPERAKIVGTFVKDVNVDAGAITLTFGNSASKAIEDKKVTLRPAVVPGEPAVPIAWLCHRSAVPTNMEVRGKDDTDIPSKWLPLECRTAETK